MATANLTPALNERVFACEPPTAIRYALERLVVADKGLFADRQTFKRWLTDENAGRVCDAASEYDAAKEAATRLLEDFLGGRVTGYWPINGRLVGFSPVSKYGLTLRVQPDRCNLKYSGAR